VLLSISLVKQHASGDRPADGANYLDASERESLAEIVESSLRVCLRHQFYSWTQGIVQSLLPHEILICGVDDGSPQGIRLHHFSGTRYFRDEHFRAVCTPREGLIRRMMAEWQTNGEPLMLAGELEDDDAHGQLLELVQRNELRNIVAHGVRGSGHGIVGFYGFSRIPWPLGRRIAYRAQLIVPSLHATFVQVLAHEAKANGVGSRSRRQITQREVEILRWIREGKTNTDIARILAVSPWTVKNHVQTILKKLSAQTRGHAVVRAMNLGILDSQS
jgi:transcriptional regulator EpsA